MMRWSTVWEARDLVIFLVLVTLGYVFGRRAERRHFASLRRREQEFLDLPALTGRRCDSSWDVADAVLVHGIAVVSIDYFKYVAASLRNFFGGRVSAYESLLDRARREALVRMKERARARGASMVINVRMQISSVSGMKGAANQGVRSAEVLVYGTALRLR
jgi:uncharacterized protein YbjQ (UPF0145 family)